MFALYTRFHLLLLKIDKLYIYFFWLESFERRALQEKTLVTWSVALLTSKGHRSASIVRTAPYIKFLKQHGALTAKLWQFKIKLSTMLANGTKSKMNRKTLSFPTPQMIKTPLVPAKLWGDTRVSSQHLVTKFRSTTAKLGN